MTAFPLWLMRHGAPVLTGRMLGRTDCDVTDVGIATCTARARDIDFNHLVASDLIRAHRSAAAIGTPTLDPRWRELDFGDWDGLPADQVDTAALGRFWQDPDAFPPPGGERWSSLVARVGAAIDALAARPTLIVTHGGAMRAALAHLCGLSHADTFAFDLPYACVLRLNIWDGSPRRAQISGLRA